MDWFRARPAAATLLLTLLVLITLILILPDVDLPDTAFHRNSSPLAIRAHSQITQLLIAAEVHHFTLAKAENSGDTEYLVLTLTPGTFKKLGHELRC